MIKSKDCDTLDSDTTLKMLNVFHNKKAKRNIFIDFAYMDERESQYIRKIYEVTAYYNQYNMMNYNAQRYDLSQLNLVGNPLAMMNPQQSQMNPQAQMNPMMSLPTTMVRPTNGEVAGSNLGFQMNPVSKNTKKK